jgi:hypothetical protein
MGGGFSPNRATHPIIKFNTGLCIYEQCWIGCKPRSPSEGVTGVTAIHTEPTPFRGHHRYPNGGWGSLMNEKFLVNKVL